MSYLAKQGVQSMSSERVIQDRQPQPFSAKHELSAKILGAAELGAAWRNAYVEMGSRALIGSLDFWGGGLKPFTDTSRFLKAEIARPNLDQLPKEAIWEDERAVLYKYETPETLHPGCEHQYVPLVPVFALMNSEKILARNLIPEMLMSGFDVYGPAWKKPKRGDENSGLEDYFLHTLPEILEQVKKDSSVDEISLLGWCQGGFGATILTSLQGQMAERAGLPREHGLGIRNLIQLTTPLSISEESKKRGGFAKMTSDPSFDPEAIVKANNGVFPGSLIDYAARELKSYDNNIGTHINLMRLILDGNEAKIK
ncbi:MAG: hypothetical protein ACMG55_12330, partial [Microcoleus sp.]